MKSVDLFRVIKPGLFTSVQDLGRFGYQRFGVPVSGAMDKYALVCANTLVGNSGNDACLEVTLLGPELEVLNSAQISLTGAEFSVSINDEIVQTWALLNVKKGDIITFVGRAERGCRAYVAVRGGIDAPIVLGSRSTYVRGGFGGYEGCLLQSGNVIRAFEPLEFLKERRVMPAELIPKYESEIRVDVILGPQEDMFTTEGVETFLSYEYTLTTESDRMGYRLDGALVKHRDATEILTDPLLPGAVQVPGNGKPIVLMVDAQTTGGYPKIATTTTPSLFRLGQAKPGDIIRFKETSSTKAREDYLEFYTCLGQLEMKLIKQLL